MLESIIGALVGALGTGIVTAIFWKLQQKRDTLARSQVKAKAIDTAVNKLLNEHIMVLNQMGPQATFPAPENMASKAREQKRERLRKIIDEAFHDL
jgi:hypothetical protein